MTDHDTIAAPPAAAARATPATPGPATAPATESGTVRARMPAHPEPADPVPAPPRAPLMSVHAVDESAVSTWITKEAGNRRIPFDRARLERSIDAVHADFPPGSFAEAP